VKSILKNGLDSEPLPEPVETAPIQHDNVRGAGYYRVESSEETSPC